MGQTKASSSGKARTAKGTGEDGPEAPPGHSPRTIQKGGSSFEPRDQDGGGAKEQGEEGPGWDPAREGLLQKPGASHSIPSRRG